MKRTNLPTQRARQARQARQAGVALLEVLVSILIFSFGVLGLIGLQARAISFSVDAEDRNRAALFANEVASAMWMNKSVALDTSTGTPSWTARIADATQSGLPAGTVTITAAPGVTNSADVTITWKAPQRATADPVSRLTTRVTLPPP